MAHASDARFLVLHALRLKGFAEIDGIAEQAGLYPSEVRNFLEHLRVSELVARREGRVSGWTLTPAGRFRHAELIAADVDGSGCRPAVEAAYERFVAVNPELLAVCTAWQLRSISGEQVLNDHRDGRYDAQVRARLKAVDAAVQPICRDLSRALGRFGVYGPRLTTALRRVEAGDADWFTKPGIDSYHSVWFELHEDLLLTLGLERSKVEA